MPFKKGHTINNGRKRTPEQRKKDSEVKLGEKNYWFGRQGKKSAAWKGNNIGYGGIHDWVKKWKGKPNYCESCGTTKAKRFEWANVDHKYRRVLEDYIRMCSTCHKHYDRQIKYEQSI